VDEVRRRLPVSGIVWLVFGAAYFVVPLAATAEFSLRGGQSGGYSFDAYRSIFSDPDFRATLWLSFRLALETIAISLVLFLPTIYWMHLKLPRVRPVMELLSVLPFVVPPVVLVVGLLDLYRPAPQFFIATPQFLVAAYVILAFPYVYWALDSGIRAIDVRTLTEASQSLGANWWTTFRRVIVPNLRVAALSGAFLTLAIVMGEFTIANLALFYTFPVYINYIGQTTAYPAAALTVISFAITWLAILGLVVVGWGVGGGRRPPVARAA
jgi:putative spermidine/putrescine transport system permease protein